MIGTYRMHKIIVEGVYLKTILYKSNGKKNLNQII